MREEIADFLVEKRGDMLVDGGAADVSDKTHEIGRGDIELVGIEAYLALFAEVAIEMMEEYLVDLFLVAEVVGDGALLIRQLFEKKLEDVEHTLYHLDFVDVLMAHDVAHEMEDIEHTLVFFVGKLIAARLFCYELVDKATFSLEVGRNVDKGGNFLRSDEQEVVGRKVLDFCISVGMELELALTLFYQDELGEESALLHHGIEVGIGRGGGINLDAPQELQTKEVTGNSFTAGWAAVEGAESYTLELRQKTDSPTVEEAEKITEDLSGWGEGVQGDSNTDISDELDDMMKHTGWTGQKVFECQGKAKLGSSKVVGYLISPAVADVSTSSVTVRVKSTTYSADPATMNVALLDAGGEVINTTQFAMNGSMATAVLDNPTGGDYKVKIYPKKRAYVEAIGIYDGAFTEDDFASVVSAPKPVLAMGIKGKQTITGVTETTYRFENLEPSLVYQWRVKTVANNVVSSWTAWQDVELQTTPSCINGLTVTDGTLVEVFTVSGSPVGKMTYGRFLQSPLASGIYLLKSGDGVMRIVK